MACVIGIIVAAVLIFLVANLWNYTKKAGEQILVRSRQGAEESVEAARGAAEEYDKELEEKYFQSPLTKRIIASISDGTGRLPEQIDVHADRVTGRTEGAVRAFDFLTERVPKLEKKSFAYKDTVFDGGEYYTKYECSSPEEALATAINRILGGEYDMHWEYQGSYPHSWKDHVVLTLKATIDF